MKMIRDTLKQLFDQMLLGPFGEDEILESKPSDMYLTGILWPPDVVHGAEEDDELLERPVQDSDDVSVDRGTPVHNIFKPSSIGITCFIDGTATPFNVAISGARYRMKRIVDPQKNEVEKEIWTRQPVKYLVSVEPNEKRAVWKTSNFILPLSGEMISDTTLAVHIKRRVMTKGLDVTVTLINTSDLETQMRDENCFFQSCISIEIPEASGKKILARTAVKSVDSPDSLTNILLYRNVREYAVGHGVSASWNGDPGGVRAVRTSWIPQHIVSSISPDGHPSVKPFKERVPCPLSAEYLSRYNQRKSVIKSLHSFCDIYGAWIEGTENKIGRLTGIYADAGRYNVARCGEALARMEKGISLLEKDNHAWKAFCLANEAMDNQSKGAQRGKDAGLMIWRPFQLAFILLCLTSLVDPTDGDRGCLDLLWFPTGGGKTEAYLTLIAFLIFYRRLSEQYCRNHGNVDVLTRYTLRLLTIQQFQRASAMICACDQIRKRISHELGNTPISIGLYVGQGSTPNWIVSPSKAANDVFGSIDAFTAIEQEKAGKHPSCTPRQILHCPLCGNPLGPDCYRIDRGKRTMAIICANSGCKSNHDPLPIHTVDEEIYRVLPSLIISTVDKLAQLPRNEDLGRLFGLHSGLPPALIIQDELHLISGPLGTMVGLYETGVDLLCKRNEIRPKIIGSTATIERASNQVKALFDRTVFQFPPPGLDPEDSFFAVQDSTKPDRLYTCVCSSGRSQKFTLQAVIAALIQISKYLLDGGAFNKGEVDPFWTCVAYFNSLRELGGAEVMIHDDVKRSADVYAKRLNCHPRELESRELVELTSRVPSNRIPEHLETLKVALYSEPEQGVPVDIVLASNMISVGVDIPRLGLMVVNGQPKSTSEYIQATSRIGRGLPGLIVTCLNTARPRDLSHFEHFKQYHQTLYRNVEPTSVTPWSPRARDKALHAVFAAVVRHLVAGMVSDDGASQFDATHEKVKYIADYMIRRAQSTIVGVDVKDISNEISEIMRFWEKKVSNQQRKKLEYWARVNPFNLITNYPLMRNAEDSRIETDIWPAQNSLRDVEPSAYFTLWPKSNDADQA